MLKRAFSLIEVLVVVAIIAMLLAILLPSLQRARDNARGAVCLSNLHQLGFAAQAYGQTSDGSYPIAYYTTLTPTSITQHEWDFTTTREWATGSTKVTPGVLWRFTTNLEVHQCPAFRGASNGIADPFTGYNYNISYIGHGQNESSPPLPPLKLSQVKRVTQCALFGDGEWAQGANKYMRAPFSNPGDASFSDSFRYSGTQGYRHVKRTNVVFCDGHATPVARCFLNTDPLAASLIADGTGFLSSDNQAYSPD